MWIVRKSHVNCELLMLRFAHLCKDNVWRSHGGISMWIVRHLEGGVGRSLRSELAVWPFSISRLAHRTKSTWAYSGCDRPPLCYAVGVSHEKKMNEMGLLIVPILEELMVVLGVSWNRLGGIFDRLGIILGLSWERICQRYQNSDLLFPTSSKQWFIASDNDKAVI